MEETYLAIIYFSTGYYRLLLFTINGYYSHITGYFKCVQVITSTGYSWTLHSDLHIYGQENESHFLVYPTKARINK